MRRTDLMIQPVDLRSKPGEPTWEIARLFPAQGNWTEAEYLALSDRTEQRIELSDGFLEVLPLPSLAHQRIFFFLAKLLDEFVTAHLLGEVIAGSYPVKLWSSKFRVPDILFIRQQNIDRAKPQFTSPPDLAVEIVSEDRDRDFKEKREEYAKAGIREYWIIDPRDRVIHVLTLHGKTYELQGEFRDQTPATSVLLQGFEVVPNAVWAAGEGRR